MRLRVVKQSNLNNKMVHSSIACPFQDNPNIIEDLKTIISRNSLISLSMLLIDKVLPWQNSKVIEKIMTA